MLQAKKESPMPIKFLLAFLIFLLSSFPLNAALKYGNFEGEAIDLAPPSAVLQNAQIKYDKGAYSNSMYGRYILGFKDARKASGDYKSVEFSAEVFNARSKMAKSQCTPDVYNGDMSRCALEYSMIYQATNYFEPNKIKLVQERKFLQTNIAKSEYKLFRKPTKNKAFGSYHTLEYIDLQSSSSYCHYNYLVHAGNVFIRATVTSKRDCNFDEEQQAAHRIVAEMLERLPRSGEAELPVVYKNEEVQEPQNLSDFAVETAPSSALGGKGQSAIIPASSSLGAKIFAKGAAPDKPVTFEIVSGKGGVLRAGLSSGLKVSVKADKNGAAEAKFFYVGDGGVKSPLDYEVRASFANRKESVKINVGLGLAFSRIIAVKADALDTNAFTLAVKSDFYPKLNVANYLQNAYDSGIWEGKKVGVKLRLTWVNMPSFAQPDEAFYGFTKIITAADGQTLLTVVDGSPQYYLTKYAYPAVVMKSEGKHVYRVNGGIILVDKNDKELGFIGEGMKQSDALVVVSKDTPEHWLTSLACSLEAADETQYLMLESAKMLPGGGAVEALTTASSLMCKFGKADYESLIYDMGAIIGGKYLDHLSSPDIFNKLTTKQRSAVKAAKNSYDALDEYKKEDERKRVLAESAAQRSESSESGKGVKDSLKKNVDDLKKSFEDLGNSFKGIFK